MLGILQGASILLLLSAFFAYVLAPIVDGIRLRARFGHRNRPVSRGAVIALLYILVFAPAFMVWRNSADGIRTSVSVAVPAAIDRFFGGADIGPIERALDGIPRDVPLREAVIGGTRSGIAYLEREVRETFDDLLTASRYAEWLVIVPLAALILITAAPGFRRSAQRLLPHGHLQWRAGEYLRDVNSALAGYVRAQLSAGLIVGAMSTIVFVLMGLPHPIAMGIASGVLELAPAVGPATAFLMAITQAEGHSVAVIFFFVTLRIAQDYLVYPRLVRHGMHLSTPVVVLAIWFGAALAGATGVILAIPVAGLVSVSLRHWQEYRDIERVVDAQERTPAGEP